MDISLSAYTSLNHAKGQDKYTKSINKKNLKNILINIWQYQKGVYL